MVTMVTMVMMVTMVFRPLTAPPAPVQTAPPPQRAVAIAVALLCASEGVSPRRRQRRSRGTPKAALVMQIPRLVKVPLNRRNGRAGTRRLGKRSSKRRRSRSAKRARQRRAALGSAALLFRAWIRMVSDELSFYRLGSRDAWDAWTMIRPRATRQHLGTVRM